jgi:hypothetical protein
MSQTCRLDQMLELGAHLATSRRGYTHHGIHVGGGMVVHYAGLNESWNSGPVEEVPISQFSKGRAIRIIRHRQSMYSPQDIVVRARSRLGEDKYHVLRNNCEHFCNWCISGRSRSAQVGNPLAITLRALVIAACGASQLPQLLGTRRALGRPVAPADCMAAAYVSSSPASECA